MKREEAIKAIEDNRPRSGYIILNEALDMAITALQNQPVWIPVSEILPEKGAQVLCCNKYGSVFTSCITAKIKKSFYFGKHYDVIAWMPLPEPYRESEEQ